MCEVNDAWGSVFDLGCLDVSPLAIDNVVEDLTDVIQRLAELVNSDTVEDDGSTGLAIASASVDSPIDLGFDDGLRRPLGTMMTRPSSLGV